MSNQIYQSEHPEDGSLSLKNPLLGLPSVSVRAPERRKSEGTRINYIRNGFDSAQPDKSVRLSKVLSLENPLSLQAPKGRKSIIKKSITWITSGVSSSGVENSGISLVF